MSNDRRFMPVAIEKSWKDKYGFPGDGQGYEPTAAQMNVAMAVSQDFENC